MATQSKFVYQFELDAATAEATAQRLAQIYQQQLSQIKIPLLGNDPSAQAAVAEARAQQAQITSDARAQSAERINASQAESEERIQQARAASAQIIEEEKRQTAAMQAEIKEREQAQRQSQVNSSSFGQNAASFAGAAFGGPVGGLIGAAVGGNPFFAAGLAVNQGAQFLTDANQMAVAYNRQNLAALQLAGSQDKLNQLMGVYDRDTGSVIEKAQEVADITKLESLGFANNAKQLDEFARAAKGISLAQNAPVSQEDEQLATAIITRRAGSLRELGLNADEVKDKVARLQAADKSLSDTQAYSQAVLDTAIDKFGGLATSEAGAATGMERLGKAWADFKLAVGDSSWFNKLTTGVANEVQYAIRPEEQARRERSTEAVGMARAATLNNAFNYYSPDQQKGQLANLQAYEAVQGRLNEMIDKGVPGAQQYAGVMDDLANSMRSHLELGDQYVQELDYVAQKLNELSAKTSDASADNREYAEVVGGVITKQDALASGYGTLQGAVDAYNASQSTANDTMAETAHWMQVISGGQRWVLNPTTGFGQAQDVPGPPDDYFKRQQALQQGIPLSLGGKDLRTGAAQVTQEQGRAAEAAQQKAAREWESAAKKTQQEFEAAAKKMADDFEGKLDKIPGLTSPSDVTDTDLALSKAGLYKDKPDEYLRQLMSKANDPKAKNLYPNVNFGDAAQAVGVDAKTDPKIIAAAFQQAWSTGTLWSDRGNIAKFLNVGAVQRELNEQRQGAQGQQNLLDYLGLSPNIVAAAGYQGVLPGRLLTTPNAGTALGGQTTNGASMMTQGVGAVNPQDYAQMSNDAVAPIQDGLVAAVKTMGGVAGTQLADSMFAAFQKESLSLPWVQKLTDIITSQVGRNILSDLNNNTSGDIATSETAGDQR